MPLYTYRCVTCGETLEILHRIDQLKTRCGLDCKLRGAGTFGKGEVNKVVQAANVDVRTSQPQTRQERRREAKRQAALAQMGGPLSESEIAKLKKGGLTVYRKESEGRWERDGQGGEGAPKTITRPEE